jgi:3-oxoacyl-[acyl-carrier protein] reductase
MDLELAGKSALVLAASRGLGRAIAKTLCDEGVRTAICSSDPGRIEAASAEIGAYPIVADLDSVDNVGHLAKECRATVGLPDILVLNCAGPDSAAFLDITEDQWNLNFMRLWTVPIELVRLLLPEMLERGSARILWVTSVAAKQVVPGLTISSSLRAGLHGLVKSLSDECAGRGVTVNALLPGFMNTDRLKHLSMNNLSKVHIPAQRFGTAEEFASLVAFMASDRAGYITGQTIACDGGWLRS